MRSTLLRQMELHNPTLGIYDASLTPNPHRSFNIPSGLGTVTIDDATPAVDATGLPQHVREVLEEMNSESRVLLPRPLVDPLAQKRRVNGLLPPHYFVNELGMQLNPYSNEYAAFLHARLGFRYNENCDGQHLHPLMLPAHPSDNLPTAPWSKYICINPTCARDSEYRFASPQPYSTSMKEASACMCSPGYCCYQCVHPHHKHPCNHTGHYQHCKDIKVYCTDQHMIEAFENVWPP